MYFQYNPALYCTYSKTRNTVAVVPTRHHHRAPRIARAVASRRGNGVPQPRLVWATLCATAALETMAGQIDRADGRARARRGGGCGGGGFGCGEGGATARGHRSEFHLCPSLAPLRCDSHVQVRGCAVLLVAVGFGISGYLLGLQRATAGAALTDEVTSALSTPAAGLHRLCSRAFSHPSWCASAQTCWMSISVRWTPKTPVTVV
jgi:hypothetical protein